MVKLTEHRVPIENRKALKAFLRAPDIGVDQGALDVNDSPQADHDFKNIRRIHAVASIVGLTTRGPIRALTPYYLERVRQMTPSDEELYDKPENLGAFSQHRASARREAIAQARELATFDDPIGLRVERHQLARLEACPMVILPIARGILGPEVIGDFSLVTRLARVVSQGAGQSADLDEWTIMMHQHIGSMTKAVVLQPRTLPPDRSSPQVFRAGLFHNRFEGQALDKEVVGLLAADAITKRLTANRLPTPELARGMNWLFDVTGRNPYSFIEEMASADGPYQGIMSTCAMLTPKELYGHLSGNVGMDDRRNLKLRGGLIENLIAVELAQLVGLASNREPKDPDQRYRRLRDARTLGTRVLGKARLSENIGTFNNLLHRVLGDKCYGRVMSRVRTVTLDDMTELYEELLKHRLERT